MKWKFLFLWAVWTLCLLELPLQANSFCQRTRAVVSAPFKAAYRVTAHPIDTVVTLATWSQPSYKPVILGNSLNRISPEGFRLFVRAYQTGKTELAPSERDLLNNENALEVYRVFTEELSSFGQWWNLVGSGVERAHLRDGKPSHPWLSKGISLVKTLLFVPELLPWSRQSTVESKLKKHQPLQEPSSVLGRVAGLFPFSARPWFNERKYVENHKLEAEAERLAKDAETPFLSHLFDGLTTAQRALWAVTRGSALGVLAAATQLPSPKVISLDQSFSDLDDQGMSNDDVEVILFPDQLFDAAIRIGPKIYHFGREPVESTGDVHFHLKRFDSPFAYQKEMSEKGDHIRVQLVLSDEEKKKLKEELETKKDFTWLPFPALSTPQSQVNEPLRNAGASYAPMPVDRPMASYLAYFQLRKWWGDPMIKEIRHAASDPRKPHQSGLSDAIEVLWSFSQTPKGFGLMAAIPEVVPQRSTLAKAHAKKVAPTQPENFPRPMAESSKPKPPPKKALAPWMKNYLAERDSKQREKMIEDWVAENKGIDSTDFGQQWVTLERTLQSEGVQLSEDDEILVDEVVRELKKRVFE